MRCLRRYICTVKEQDYICNLIINNCENATNCAWYFYVRRFLVDTAEYISDDFVYMHYRKSHRKSAMKHAIPLRLIDFAYPYVSMYKDTCIVCIEMDENKKISVETYDCIPC